jgi:DNA-binding SARP family transcriptional activator
MQFRVLGPLEVVADDGPLPIGRGKRRTLLGLLLIDANEVVSFDRLIDGLWGPRPPAGARSSLHVLVSELRKALGPGAAEMLLTLPSGYVLQLEPDQVDRTEFERLLDAGRGELAAGEAAAAEETLREALGLWRGAPLQDFAYDEFARTEIARLGELRLEADEELIEAGLAQGRGGDLVAEIESLIARHPLRERLRGQLMLALYQAQRQADALEAYERARRTLMAELGVEPGPALQRIQHAILRHDPALEPESKPRAAAPALRRVSSRPSGPIAIAAALAIAGIGVAVFLAFHGGGSRLPRVGTVVPGSAAEVDAATNRLVGAVPLAQVPRATGVDPRDVAACAGAVWVTDGGQQTVVRIDPGASKIVATVGIGSDVRALACGFGSLWVAGGNSATVTRVSPRTNRPTATIRLGDVGGVRAAAFAITAGGGGIWTTAGADRIARIDPATNRVVERIRIPAVSSLTASGRFVWAGTWVTASRIVRLEPRGTRTRVKTFATVRPGAGVGPIDVRGHALWALVGSGTTELFEYDATTGEIIAVVDAGRSDVDLAVDGDAVWVADQDGQVVRVGPRSHTVVARIGVRRNLTAIAAGGRRVWTTVAGRG